MRKISGFTGGMMCNYVHVIYIYICNIYVCNYVYMIIYVYVYVNK
jgi:hypothetical protein